MTQDDHNDEGVKVLHRMIAYVREEALRLNIMDVVLLLEHAQDAVVAFAPSALADQAGGGCRRDPTRLDH